MQIRLLCSQLTPAIPFIMKLIFSSILILLAFLTETFASSEVPSSTPLDVSSVGLETDVSIKQVDFDNESFSNKISLLYQSHSKMVSFATKKDDSRALAEIELEAKIFLVMLGSLSIYLGNKYTTEFIDEMYRYVFFDPFFVTILFKAIPIGVVNECFLKIIKYAIY